MVAPDLTNRASPAPTAPPRLLPVRIRLAPCCLPKPPLSQPEPPTPPGLNERLVPAVAGALIYGLVIYLLVWFGDKDTLPAISGLFLMPMGVASVATILADPRGVGSIWRHVCIGWAVIAGLVVLCMLLFGEGGICAIMAAPVFMLTSAAGSALATWALRTLRRRRGASLLVVLPLAGLPIEPMLPAPERDGQVTTVMEIAAPPQEVWRHTVAIPRIAPRELKRTFSHSVVGVPQPIDARLQGNGVGAVRHLRWTGGVTFQEVVTRWEENRALSWTFRFGPESIPRAIEAHIKVDSAYLKIADGEYRLEPLPGGRTRLTLSTHYRIATPINAYCEWWGRIFLNDFHAVVLEVIRARAEKGASGAVARAPV